MLLVLLLLAVLSWHTTPNYIWLGEDGKEDFFGEAGLFIGRMSFLSPNQHHQCTKTQSYYSIDYLSIQAEDIHLAHNDAQNLQVIVMCDINFCSKNG